MPQQDARNARRKFLIGLMWLCVAAMIPRRAFAQATDSTPPQPTTAFGEEVTLSAKTIVGVAGKASWDVAFPTLLESLKSIAGVLAKQKLRRAGLTMIIYDAVGNDGFSYFAAVPLAAAPSSSLPAPFAVKQSPAGKALKFFYRGSYDSMDIFYEGITNYLDEKQVERQGVFLEEYLTDPLTTAEDKLEINVYVPVK